MELLKLRAHVNLIHVPYKGALSMGGLVKGDHTVEFNNLTTMGAYIAAGKVRVIAVGSPHRSTLMPQVPTIAESGVPGYDMVQWFGVLAPAGTGKPVISKIHSEMAQNSAVAGRAGAYARAGRPAGRQSSGGFRCACQIRNRQMGGHRKAGGDPCGIDAGWSALRPTLKSL